MKIFRFFRKRKNFRIIMVVTAIFVIPGFVIWGVSLAGSDTSGLAARVNRQPITQQDFYKALEKAERQYREVLGDSYDQIAQNIEIDKMILDNLVQEKLLAQQYKKRRIRVSSREILDAIKADPAFKDEKGSFSEQKFSEIMSRIPPDRIKEIETDVQQRIQYQKLRQDVASETSLMVSDEEMQHYVTKDSKPEEKEEVRKFILSQKEDRFFQDWLAKKKKESKIEVFVTFRKHD